ncbi:MAG TPA: extracellular solute-binding protein [Solirubrobacteraceae bacterium]
MPKAPLRSRRLDVDRARRPWAWLAVLSMLVLAGCGSSTSSSSASGGSSSTAQGAAAQGHGAVNVLYAGSLETLMNRDIGPAFTKATGYSFNGFPAGSKDLANEIKGKVRQGDVFISASPKVNHKLEGSANGDWVSWYAPFASTALVIGYNPTSSYAGALRRGPWYRVITRPGLHFGFTDPKLDPKGELAVAALGQAAGAYAAPGLRRIATDQADLFPEQDLVGRLQAGQLDAGFFYTVEASAAHIPTVGLGAIHEQATYTVTILNRAPDQRGAVAFVAFLLSPRGQALLRGAGLSLLAPAAKGSGVPSSLRQAIKTSG